MGVGSNRPDHARRNPGLVGPPIKPLSPAASPETHVRRDRRRGGGFVALAHVVDRPVDNVTRSAGGGMQAHDYWDNQAQFVEELAKVLRGLISQLPAS
ncbi:MAG: hypothetical protein ACR2MY_10390 [Candidatus Dormibacteria bacterium]